MYYNLGNKRKGVATALIATLAFVALKTTPASAAVDPTTCKRAIAKASATFDRAKLKALGTCETLKRKGKLPANTNCLTEAKTAPKIAKAQAALSTSISKACGTLALSTIGWDGSGSGGNPVLSKLCSAGKTVGGHCSRETECGGICIGGGKDENSCTFNSSCANRSCAKSNCLGGTQAGQLCGQDGNPNSETLKAACEAGGGVCNWGQGCDGGSGSTLGQCVGGTTPNKNCFASSDCGGGGICDSGCNTGSALDCQAGVCQGAMCGTNKDCGLCKPGTPNQKQSCAADGDCGKACSGGTTGANTGEPCKANSDCTLSGTCNTISGACNTGSCSGGFCSPSSGLATAGDARPSTGLCLPEDRCPSFENNGLAAVKSCDGGTKNGQFCTADAFCAGICVSGKCASGFNHDLTCTTDADCRGCKPGCDFSLASTTDVANCLTCIGEGTVDQINSTVYGELKAATYTCVGGTNDQLPCSPATASTDCPSGTCKQPASNKALEVCKQGVGTAAAKFFDSKRNFLEQCEDRIIKAGSGSCPDATATTKISTASDKLLSDIAKACAGKDKVFGGTGALNLDFAPDSIGNLFNCANFTDPNGGPACAGTGRGPINTLDDLATCIQCLTEFKVDCTDRIAAPMVGTTAQPVFAECNPLCGNGKLDGHCSTTHATICGSTLDCPSGESCIPDETCDDGNAVSGDTCPSNCVINACTPSATKHFMLISFSAPVGVDLGAMAVYVEYPDGTVEIPGHANDAQVQGSLTVPFDAFASINDLDYAVRIALIGNSGAMFPGVAAVVELDECTGASAPTNDQFRCSVESAADTNGNIAAGVSCSVTVF